MNVGNFSVPIAEKRGLGLFVALHCHMLSAALGVQTPIWTVQNSRLV